MIEQKRRFCGGKKTERKAEYVGESLAFFFFFAAKHHKKESRSFL
jgi:hypothetical protein